MGMRWSIALSRRGYHKVLTSRSLTVRLSRLLHKRQRVSATGDLMLGVGIGPLEVQILRLPQ
jgi:hypothetical protein